MTTGGEVMEVGRHVYSPRVGWPEKFLTHTYTRKRTDGQAHTHTRMRTHTQYYPRTHIDYSKISTLVRAQNTTTVTLIVFASLFLDFSDRNENFDTHSYAHTNILYALKKCQYALEKDHGKINIFFVANVLFKLTTQ